MSMKPAVITALNPEPHIEAPSHRTLFFVAMGAAIALVAGALVGGGLFKLYDALWWWDDLLHGLSGGVLSLWGYYIARQASGNTPSMSPLFCSFFAFCFALAGGVCWEIFEFLSDLSLHTAMQQWDMPAQAIVMGASYQGMGLRDTMSDLINATVGASLTTAVLYAIASRWPIAVLSVIRRAFARP